MCKVSKLFLAILPLLLLSGCNSIGDKAMSMSIVYLSAAVLSLLLLIACFVLVFKKNIWFVFLFSSILVVNTGYWLLSVSKTVETALFANRLSYLGSVFLPMAMIMIILKVTNANYHKYLPHILSAVNIFVFFVTASYPYSKVYYKSIELITINGVSVLEKAYGSWHGMYFFFLLAYFSAIIVIAIRTTMKKKLNTRTQSVILCIAVFVNICVWLLEQLVRIDFEFLSVSYIISELFLIGLYLSIEDNEKNDAVNSVSSPTAYEDAPLDEAKVIFLKEHIPTLTPTEAKIYNYYLEGKSSKEVMELLTIKENTLKYHNKNIYSKLGVSSRKELLYFSKMN
ncbi:MAG: hypothetical protein IKU60_01375 [Clostridia bacterium]|nr:hypothetical protein [Clostridia bacterium]